MSAKWSLRDVFPETEIVDASWLMQKLGLSSLDVSNGVRSIGTVTATDTEPHAASADPTRLIGSIMTPRPEMMSAPSPPANDDCEWQQKQLATGDEHARFAGRPLLAGGVNLLLEIEVHTATRAFPQPVKLKDLDPQIVPGHGDTWQLRVAAAKSHGELQEALAQVRNWLVEEGTSAATIRIAGARQIITPDP